MGNRSRFVTATAGSAAIAVGAMVRARRRSRVAQATEGFAESIMPTPTPRASSSGPVADEAHAPGHQHLHLGERELNEPRPKSTRVRPFAKHRHGMRHPGRG